MLLETYNVNFATLIGVRLRVKRPECGPHAATKWNMGDGGYQERIHVDWLVRDNPDRVSPERIIGLARMRVVRHIIHTENDVSSSVDKGQFLWKGRVAVHGRIAVDITTTPLQPHSVQNS